MAGLARLLFVLLAATLVFCEDSSAADDAEIAKLKSRIESLEKRVSDGVVTDDIGHKLHPIHSIYGLKISGGLTMIPQGALLFDSNDAGQGLETSSLAISADLAIESKVGENGRAVVVLDFQKGAGFRELSFITSPNGATTGASADVESFDNDLIHVTQAYYELDLADNLVFSVGHLDLSAYFDANAFANNERAQFIAPLFVNNPTIEFGGSGDFYGPGARLTWMPNESVDVTVGAFEGDGDYVEVFDRPFIMAELAVKVKPSDLDGNYRVYYWERHGRTDASTTADPTDASLASKKNSGIGLSFDQMVTEDIGLFARAGLQNGDVAASDSFFGAGAQVSGSAFNREGDVFGIAYGISSLSDAYESASGIDAGKEHYMEAYYNYALFESAEDIGVHLTPDVQYVMNPGADKDAFDALIFGMRLQAYF